MTICKRRQTNLPQAMAEQPEEIRSSSHIGRTRRPSSLLAQWSLRGSSLPGSESHETSDVDMTREEMSHMLFSMRSDYSATGFQSKELLHKVRSWKKRCHTYLPKTGLQEGLKTIKETKKKEALRQKDIRNFQIYAFAHWLVRKQEHSVCRRRWHFATKAVAFIGITARVMAKRSYELTVQLPTFMDIGDSILAEWQSTVIQYIDTRDFKLSKDRFCVNSDEVSILSTSPEERTEQQVNHILYKLQLISTFCDFPLHTQRSIARLAHYFRVRDKRVILREGHVPQHFYFILSGEAVVSAIVDGPNGPFRQTLNTISKGAVFGESAIINRCARAATVAARTDLQLLYIGLNEYIATFMPERLLDGIPDFIKFLSKLSWMKNWPVHLLQPDASKCYMRYYRHRHVIVVDSTSSDNLYIVRSGACHVLMMIQRVPVTWRDVQQLIDQHVMATSEKGLGIFCEERLEKLQRNQTQPRLRALSASDIRRQSVRQMSSKRSLQARSVPPQDPSNNQSSILNTYSSSASPETEQGPGTEKSPGSSSIQSKALKKTVSISEHTPVGKSDENGERKLSSQFPYPPETARPPESRRRSKAIKPAGSKDDEAAGKTAQFPETSSYPRHKTSSIGENSKVSLTDCGDRAREGLSKRGRIESSVCGDGILPRKSSLRNTKEGWPDGTRSPSCSSVDTNREYSSEESRPSVSYQHHVSFSSSLSTVTQPRFVSGFYKAAKKYDDMAEKLFEAKSCWTRRREYQIPKQCQPASRPVSAPAHTNKLPPAFVLLATLREGDVFGLDAMEMPVCSQPKAHKVSLVSCGAEVITLKKRFFVQHASANVQQEVHLATRRYPCPEEVEHEWRMQEARHLWQARLKKDCRLSHHQHHS